jgi:hypothetical protein
MATNCQPEIWCAGLFRTRLVARPLIAVIDRREKEYLIITPATRWNGPKNVFRQSILGVQRLEDSFLLK